jgi:hypothetical protein
MTRRLARVALVLFIAAAATAGFARFRESPGTGPKPVGRLPLLSVHKDKLDLGEVWEDQQFAWTLPVANNGTESVHVEEVRTSCGCVVAQPRAFTLRPGETHPLRLTLNLTPRSSEAVGVPRAFAAEVMLTTRTDSTPAAHETFALTARVRPVLEVRPREPSFGVRSDHVQPPLPMSFTVVPATPLESLTAIPEMPGFTASVRPTGPELTVTVTPTAPVPIGPLKVVVRLVPLQPGGHALPERRVTIGGAVGQDVIADPPEVSVGGRPVGTEARETLTVSSRTGRILTVQRVAAHGDGLTAELNPDGTVRVRQAMTRPGELAGRVEITAQPEGGSPVVVVVPVVGYAAEPEGAQR